MSVSSVSDAELGLTKIMPVDKAVLMADLYHAPELLNYYCLNECPIGCRRSISDKLIDIDRAAVSLTQSLRTEKIRRIKHSVVDVAADGELADDEFEEFDRTVSELGELAKLISELEIIRDKEKMKRKGENGRRIG